MIDLAQVRAALPLPALMSRLGLGPHAKAKAHCPWHEDKNASFGIFERGGRWYAKCQAGCNDGKALDEVDLLAKVRGISKGEAIKEYADLAGFKNGQEREGQDSTPPPKNDSNAILERSTGVQANILDPKPAPITLEALNEQAIEKLAKWRGFDSKFVKALCDSGKISVFVDHAGERCLAFPLRAGGAHYRKKDGSWRYTEGAKPELFIIGEIEEGANVHCFESQFDGLAYADASGEENNIVATRGVANAKLIIQRFKGHTGTLYLWPQNDEPGQKWARDIRQALPNEQIKICDVPIQPLRKGGLPAFKDLNDWRKGGASEGAIFNAFVDARPFEAKDFPVLPQADLTEGKVDASKSVSEVPDRGKQKAAVSDATTAKTGGGENTLSGGVDRGLQDRTPTLVIPAPGRQSDTSSAQNLSQALDQIVVILGRYVRFPETWEPNMVALWCAYTWLFDSFWYTPYLHVYGPETNCGKSTVLKCVARFARNPWKPIASEAALYLKIEQERPTILLDELDTIWNDKSPGNEALRAILNAGFEKDGKVAKAPRGQLTEYQVFCPKALAGIGGLPNTISNRAIPIPMTKQLPSDRAGKWREREVELETQPIRSFFKEWSGANTKTLVEARPEMPADLDSRYEDLIEPILAVADLAGDHWPQDARDAAVLAFSQPVEDSNQVKLLRSMRAMFLTLDKERVSSEQVVKFLVEQVEDAPWPNWWERDVAAGRWHGAARKVAAMLKGFGIHPKCFRDEQGESTKGYIRIDFDMVWRRYLPSEVKMVEAELKL